MKYIRPSDHADSHQDCHPSQRQHHVKPVSSKLHVITAITNPNRFYARYKLFHAFEKMVEDAGAVLTTVELAVRDRHFEVTDSANPDHVQLRSPDLLWHKENLVNIGVRQCLWRYPEAEYFAWIDADVQFVRPDWVNETLHQLQIYKVVQMWSHSIDLGPDLQPIASCASLISSYIRDRQILQPIHAGRGNANSAVGRGPGIFRDEMADAYGGKPKATGLLHSGYAWAARRSALADLGGLGDIAILGSGDRHMAYALLGEVKRSFPKNLSQSYYDYWLEWQDRAEEFIQRKVGIVPGTLLHYWHGSKAHRRYQDRWHILAQNKFDWMKDLKKDPQGVWQLTSRNWRLRDDLLNYFFVRNEDSQDL